jgi:hypothetical protein
MIIVPSAFVLSEAATDTPLTHPRIGYQTWLRDLLASDVTVSSEDDEGPADAPLKPDTYSFWEPTSLPATWLVDLGATRAVDYVGIVGRIGSVGCSIAVDTNDGDQIGSPLEDEWVEFASDVAPSDDAPLLFLDASRNIRKIRLTITGSGEMPRLSVVYAGEVLKMQRPIYGGHSPGRLSRVTTLNGAMSLGGQFLGQDFRKHGVESSYSFRHLTAAWVRSDFDPFVKSARKFPYFAGWRPSAFSAEVDYGWTPEDIRVSNMGLRTFMQTTFPMVGWGYE